MFSEKHIQKGFMENSFGINFDWGYLNMFTINNDLRGSIYSSL